MQWQERAPSFSSPLPIHLLFIISYDTADALPWALWPELKTERKPKGVDTPFCQRSNPSYSKMKNKFYFRDDGCHTKQFTTKHYSQDFISIAVYSGGATNIFERDRKSPCQEFLHWVCLLQSSYLAAVPPFHSCFLPLPFCSDSEKLPVSAASLRAASFVWFLGVHCSGSRCKLACNLYFVYILFRLNPEVEIF